ncbi:hypothetical protein C8R44DRAFT_735978 [Mycena epipterygia]|nr:hypothetical protein C8R44DRAFT_735978 [Mycena epipterygia]
MFILRHKGTEWRTAREGRQQRGEGGEVVKKTKRKKDDIRLTYLVPKQSRNHHVSAEFQMTWHFLDFRLKRLLIPRALPALLICGWHANRAIMSYQAVVAATMATRTLEFDWQLPRKKVFPDVAKASLHLKREVYAGPQKGEGTLKADAVLWTGFQKSKAIEKSNAQRRHHLKNHPGWWNSHLLQISFTRSFNGGEGFPVGPAGYLTQYYAGTWNVSTDTIAGSLGDDQDPATHDGMFVFKRMPPENMCFVPAPVELESGKARALWGFAIAAVIQGVRRDRWAWSFFKERRDNRRRFIELYIRSGSGTHQFGQWLTDLEEQDLARVRKSLTTQDSRFYHFLAEQRIRTITDHGRCAHHLPRVPDERDLEHACELSDLVRARTSTYKHKQAKCGKRDEVDFCELPGCITSRVSRDDMQKPHLPHHDLMKVRRVVHIREFGKIFRNAKEALKGARELFKSSADRATAVKPADDSQSELGTDEERHAPMSANRLSRIPALAVSIPKTLAESSSPASGHPMSAVSPLKQLPDSVASGPRCRGCSKPVSQPCWYCVQCVEPSFICWECDAKGKEFKDHNILSHDLVRVQELVVEKDLISIEERLTELDVRFGQLEAAVDGRMVTINDQFGRLEGRTVLEETMNAQFGRLEAVVEGRMVAMEKLLEQLLTRIS